MPGVFEFGPFRLDAADHTLTRDGAVLPVAPMVFRTLCALVGRAGRLVSREELTRLVWPNSFVAGSTLSQNVWLLRKLLGRRPDGEEWIETHPRLGYRFNGAVRQADQGPRGAGPARPGFRLQLGPERYPLTEGETILGRDPEAHVRIEDETVSRRHARIEIKGGSATIEDLGSKNGTWAGGSRVSGPVPLTDGVPIRLGSVELLFRSRTPPDPTITLPLPRPRE